MPGSLLAAGYTEINKTHLSAGLVWQSDTWLVPVQCVASEQQLANVRPA